METMPVLNQDTQPSDREAVSGDGVIWVRRYVAPECCGVPTKMVTSKRNGDYRRYQCAECGKRVSIGSKGIGRPKKEG